MSSSNTPRPPKGNAAVPPRANVPVSGEIDPNTGAVRYVTTAGALDEDVKVVIMSDGSARCANGEAAAAASSASPSPSTALAVSSAAHETSATAAAYSAAME